MAAGSAGSLHTLGKSFPLLRTIHQEPADDGIIRREILYHFGPERADGRGDIGQPAA
jgi:hypothetical protein